MRFPQTGEETMFLHTELSEQLLERLCHHFFHIIYKNDLHIGAFSEYLSTINLNPPNSEALPTSAHIFCTYLLNIHLWCF